MDGAVVMEQQWLCVQVMFAANDCERTSVHENRGILLIPEIKTMRVKMKKREA